MSTITITSKEYADLYGCSQRYVNNQANKSKPLKHVFGVRQSGATWLLEVDKKWYDSKHCDVCGSTKLVEYPAMGVNCENCHPLKK